jgi:hypothetical protein
MAGRTRAPKGKQKLNGGGYLVSARIPRNEYLVVHAEGRRRGVPASDVVRERIRSLALETNLWPPPDKLFTVGELTELGLAVSELATAILGEAVNG